MNRTVGVALASFAVALCLPATAFAGAVATTNGKIAFERGLDIFTVNPDGTNKTNLTATDGAIESQAVFSPNGQSLALVRTPLKSGLSSGEDDVWVMDADGSNPRQVTNVGEQIESLHWTADGARLLYFAERDANSNNAELYSILPDGTGLTTVTAAGPGMDGGMSMSTALDKVVFAAIVAPSTNREIYAVNLNGSGFTQITNDPGDDTSPVIAPNASRVAWATDRHNPPNEFSLDAEIYAANVDGTNQQRLTTTNVDNYPVEYSADATLIGYNRSGEASLMRADGSSPRELTDTSHFAYFEQFSPDGNRIAISDVLPLPGEDPHYRIQTISPEGDQPVNVTNRDDDAVFEDWQASLTRPTDPPMELTATAKKKQRAGTARAKVECSNECLLSLKATVKAGGDRFTSTAKAGLYGNEPQDLRMMKKKVAKKVEGERGTVKLKIAVIEGVGGEPKTTVKSKLKR